MVRRSENGNEWAEKDINDNRFTDAKEIWLTQNDPAVYTAKPGITAPLFAVADRNDAVMLVLLKAPVDYGTFAVYDGDRKLGGTSAKGKTNHQIVISLEDAIIDVSRRYVVRDESGAFGDKPVTMRNILDGFYYGGGDLGLTESASATGFKVWSPAARAVSVALYGNAGTYDANGKVTDNTGATLYKMEKDPVTGVWSALVPGSLMGKFYLYRAEFADGSVNYAADPYAKAVSANGQRMAIISMSATNPPNWKAAKAPFAAMQDAILYELHIRDFSIDDNSGMRNKGKYLAFTERATKNSEGAPTGIDHLVNLGVTHIHLLPSFDFASINELTVDDPASANGKFNWGYDPQSYNVPEGSYASDPRNPSVRISEFKQMVQALHDAGLRVVMDVVYNHTFQTGGNPFDAIVPAYYYRTSDTGAYANGSGCGNEVASERPMVRKFIIDSCLYWAREYHIDGFRFDLMGLIDTPTMQQLTEAVRKVDPGIIIYGEPWTAGASALPTTLQTTIGAQKDKRFAVFNDHIRGAIKGGSDDDTRGFATGKSGVETAIAQGILGSIHDFTGAASESINYVTAHDNLNLWDKIAFSLGAKDLANKPYSAIDPAKRLLENDAVKAVLLADGIILTAQGIPFFQAGDEFLRSKFGHPNSYTSPDAINRIRWENASRYRELIAYHAGLIKLRKAHPAFRMNTGDDIDRFVEILTQSDRTVSFVLKQNANKDSWRSIFVAYNANSIEVTLKLPATAALWQQVVNAEEAGTETLAGITGGVLTLPPLSMAVLHD